MYNFQVKNNFFYILYEVTNLKTASVYGLKPTIGQDDFKFILIVQCSYFTIKLSFIELGQNILMEIFFKLL